MRFLLTLNGMGLVCCVVFWMQRFRCCNILMSYLLEVLVFVQILNAQELLLLILFLEIMILLLFCFLGFVFLVWIELDKRLLFFLVSSNIGLLILRLLLLL